MRLAIVHHCLTRGVLLAAHLMLAAPTPAQEWIKLAPFPTGEDLDAVAAVTPEHIFVVGRNGAIHQTHDGGATWTQIILEPSYDDQPYLEVVFPDSQHGYIFGNGDYPVSNHNWRTTDGGVTWTQMTGVGSVREADFITPTVGFAGVNGGCYFTPDGGASWQLRSNYLACPVTWGMDFRDEQVGLIAGSAPPPNHLTKGVFRTDDGGYTWSLVLPAGGSTYGFNDVIYLSNGEALAARNEGAVFKSVDDGLTWTQISPPFSPGIIEFTALDLQTIVAVAYEGQILRSADGGYTWSIVDGGPSIGKNISALGAQHVYVVGHNGFIRASSDAGQTWDILNNGVGDQVTDIEMLNEQFGLAVTKLGYVQRTTDGGATWQVQKLFTQVFGFYPTLETVSIVDESFALAAGQEGMVFRTFDGGVTWEPVGYPALPPVYFEDVKMIDKTTGWLTGFYQGGSGVAYKTTDGGATWTLAFQPYAPYSVEFVDEQHGWITTDNGSSFGPDVYSTVNGGASWQLTALPNQPTGGPPLTTIRFANPDFGWAVGWFDYFARKTPSGWSPQSIPGPAMNFLGLSVISPTEAWAIGASTGGDVKAFKTTDGTTWTTQYTDLWPAVQLSNVTALPSGHAWIAGNQGLILSNMEPVPAVPGDVTGDQSVNVDDLLVVINGWGLCRPPCSADLNGNGTVDVDDLLIVINNWT